MGFPPFYVALSGRNSRFFYLKTMENENNVKNICFK